MNNFLKHLLICTILATHGTMSAFSFKKIYSYVMPNKIPQEIVYEEYPAKKVTKLTVKNKNGNITLKTDATQSAILLKGIKKALEEEQLGQFKITQKIVAQEMIIEIAYDESIDGSVDLEIIAPKTVALDICTIEGSIFIKEPHKQVYACTQKGPIEIVNPLSSIDAVTQNKGTITIYKPQDQVKAQTNQGNIVIHDAQSTVFANSTYGNVQLFAKEVPSTSMIKLTSVSGSISVHLPSDVNADVQASTKHGTIFSDHFITLKPQTTQLNKYTWKRLQQHIDGTLGTGEAQIKLSSVRSDIKLLELKA